MGQRPSLRSRAVTVVAAGAWLAGCASVAPLPWRDAAGSIEQAPIELGGRRHDATWYRPAAEPGALLVLQHGFGRRCHHLRETTRQLMAAPVVALCIDAPMAGGNAALADALATGLAQGLRGPGEQPLPLPVIVGGHSAGAVFAARVGARLQVLAPQRLAAALLFDPVTTGTFEADLLRLSDGGRRPVLALPAAPHGCNAEGNARPVLQRAGDAARAAGRDTLQVVPGEPGSTHVDVEGSDSDALARLACGTPLPAPVARLREQALAWLRAQLSRGGASHAPLSD